LFYYAEWMNNNGVIRQWTTASGNKKPDLRPRRWSFLSPLVHQFAKGETRYYDQAQQQIKSIVDPTLSIGVSNIFLPDSELQFALNARNVKRTISPSTRSTLPATSASLKTWTDEGEGTTKTGSEDYYSRTTAVKRGPEKSDGKA